mgnify:FL=1|tara:strand:+ start:180 stop:482 length:303 start_codon:yes stop_codon:yes gene_type:complete
MNGKGDKPRFLPDSKYRDNYNKIFGEKQMKVKDGRGYNTEFKIGQKVCIQEDIPSVDGMLYKNTIAKIDEINYKTKQFRITDRVGKVWWVKSSQISGSFL